jgi:integrase
MRVEFLGLIITLIGLYDESSIDEKLKERPVVTNQLVELPSIDSGLSATVRLTIEENLASWGRAAAGAFAGNSERASRADMRIWLAWCHQNGSPVIITAPDVLVAFIDAMAASKAPATVRRYVSSVGKLHRAAGQPDPTAAEAVKLAKRRMQRAKGTRQKQAAAITGRERNAMVAVCGDGVRGLRDAALLNVAYDTMARRSEVVALDLPDVNVDEGGSGSALIRRGKTDQEGAGALRYLSSTTVRALIAWVATAGITEGGLFRAVHKGGLIGERLQDQDVRRIYRRLAATAGLPAETVAGIGGHSTRVGAAQDMVAAGLGVSEVMQAGGWKTPAMVARYSERAAVKQGAAAKLAAIQGRN